ncbi:hypothetical protein PF010_g3984 [Phytophthora fragariae]|uniref:DDE-1 domain-containing protein n=2 Tax=Phytophthora fragariae TaxID=53985 RepID=A0A6G0LSL6_9STRA|nr:hypothetical protein PF010_g3984 [Phytophthora fragariae]
MVKGRQKHTKNGRRKPRAYKLSVPMHQFRLNVVFFFEDHSMEETVDKFYKGLAGTQLRTKRTSVYLWRKRKARLVELCQSTGTATQRKVRLRERQVEKHEAAMAAAESVKMVAPAREDVAEYVAQAWDELSAYTIANGFKAVLQEGVEDEASQHQIN